MFHSSLVSKVQMMIWPRILFHRTISIQEIVYFFSVYFRPPVDACLLMKLYICAYWH